MIVPYVYSLLEFQRRVLTQGIPTNEPHTAESVKQLLFFNKIFISNCNEMFERYDMIPYSATYSELLGIYISNINRIIDIMQKELHINIRFDYGFEQRLLIDTEIGDQLMRTYHPVLAQGMFFNNTIYYISTAEGMHNSYHVSWADDKRIIYNKALSTKINGKKVYMCTVDTLMHYDDEFLNMINLSGGKTVAIRVIYKQNSRVAAKVECSGDLDLASEIAKTVFPEALVVHNPFLYIDDLEYMLDDFLPVVHHEKQAVLTVSPLSLMTEDKILEYPFDSFDDYLYFLKSALMDDDVTDIYITLYRIGKDPSIYYLLRDAVKKGVKVHVQLEMNARGDEKLNLIWRKEFIKAGIEVTNFMRGTMKVHCKLTLVEFNNRRSVVQVGTGNYHTKTATQYTDLNLITSDEEICKTAKKIFKMFKKGELERPTKIRDLLYLDTLRAALTMHIQNEIVKGKNGFIFIKCNTLDDKKIISQLKMAEKAGCHIELVIRSACTWMPESPNVRIRSIVWDKLEHSRVWCFGRLNPVIYLGSLDLATKKLDRRVECMVRIKSPCIISKMADYINRYIVSTNGSWILQDGKYLKEDKI